MGAKSFYLKEDKFFDDFLIFELEWEQGKVVWSVDGNQYATFDIDVDYLTEFHKEFFILFNVAVGDTWAGRPDDASVFPQYIYVDWVRV